MAYNPVLNPVYDNDYFTAAQASIYIGDTLIDEVTSFSYQTIQQKVPLYGYASQLFDTVAPGQVIVRGEFTINFKEQSYLWMVLRRWFNLFEDPGTSQALGIKDPLSQEKAKALFQAKYGARTDGLGGRPIIGKNGTAVMAASIERQVQGKLTQQEKFERYMSLAGYASVAGKDTVFEDIANIFEDQLWDTSNDDDLLAEIRRTDDNIFDGFDIYVLWGNYANPRANHTAQKICGVRLTSQGKAMKIDGLPIQEHYTFMAKTVV